MEQAKWYETGIGDVLKKLETSCEGLSNEEAERRQETYGFNELKERKGRSLWRMLLKQFTNVLVAILLAAAAISGILGEISDAIVIMAVVALNAVLGVVQEDKAEKSLAALKKLAAPSAVVKRNGNVMEIPARELVPGDILLLDAGRYVPADCRIVQSFNLKAEESSLTGESIPVEKSDGIISGNKVGLGDRKNMLFMSSMITYGRGTAVVTATGMDTEIGRIASLIEEEDKSITPLQLKLQELGKWLGITVVGICAAMFFTGILEGRQYLVMFMTSISLAVAAIPEGLPAVVTIVLAIGVQKMIKRNAIIRKLPAVETLGCATVICSDKTGTLTQNKMTVMKIYSGKEMMEAQYVILEEDNEILFSVFVLCNDTQVIFDEGKIKYVGDPTETALVEFAHEKGIEKADLERLHERVGELPFDSERKLMTSINAFESMARAYVKGAPDILLKKCRYIFDNGKVRELKEEDLEKIQKVNENMSEGALRVLGGAYRDFAHLPDLTNVDDIENELTFIGLIGMMDPPRQEVKDAVMVCKSAGIRPVMITGDHKITAVAIASELEILGENHKALSGVELNDIDDETLTKDIEKYSVYARVSPEHKLRIVKAWQARGEVVAMTGDGVNDAPALKKADIGAAMGITGTDVAKEASDMVLTDDNFATIVAAIEEGRSIYSNIRKTIHYLLSCNIGEIITLFTAIVLGWAEPLIPIHILWINLVTDTLPALALGLERSEKGIMGKRPRNSKSSIFDEGLGVRIIAEGLLIGIISLLAYSQGLRFGLETARTETFIVLSLSQLFHAQNVRCDRDSIFKTGIFANKYLIGAIFFSILVQLGVIFIPFTKEIFKVTSLDLGQLLITIGFSLVPVFVIELIKLVRRLSGK